MVHKQQKRLTSLSVPRNGVEPLRPLLATGFSYRYSFRCSCLSTKQNLWSGLSLRHIRFLNLGALRLVSTPFPKPGLGSGLPI